MTPSEPDRYDKRVGELARHVEELIFDGDEECGSRLRWSLRRMAEEVEAETLERAAQRIAWIQPEYTAREVQRQIRALASPAAAPAAETIICGPTCPGHPPSEPAPPAPTDPCQRCGKLGGHPVDFRFDGISTSRWICPHCLDAQEKRITELEAALRELTRAATDHANAHGCSGDLGARLSDAKALLAARTSPGAAGEGT